MSLVLRRFHQNIQFGTQGCSNSLNFNNLLAKCSLAATREDAIVLLSLADGYWFCCVDNGKVRSGEDCFSKDLCLLLRKLNTVRNRKPGTPLIIDRTLSHLVATDYAEIEIVDISEFIKKLVETGRRLHVWNNCSNRLYEYLCYLAKASIIISTLSLITVGTFSQLQAHESKTLESKAYNLSKTVSTIEKTRANLESGFKEWRIKQIVCNVMDAGCFYTMSNSQNPAHQIKVFEEMSEYISSINMDAHDITALKEYSNAYGAVLEFIAGDKSQYQVSGKEYFSYKNIAEKLTGISSVTSIQAKFKDSMNVDWVIKGIAQ